MDTNWHGTGNKQMVPGGVDKVPDFDPRSGDHLWIISSMYRWGGPTTETPTLDMENLLLVVGPGCFYCEAPYSELMFKRRCKGEPKQ